MSVSQEWLDFKFEVVALWNAGGTFSTIADATGVTRSSVAGIIGRAGDAAQTRPSPIRRDGVHSLRSRDRPVPLKIVPSLIELVGGEAVLMPRKPPVVPVPTVTAAHRCQYPMWPDELERPPRPAVFCEAPTTLGRSYCPAHAKIAFTRRPERETTGDGWIRLGPFAIR